MALDTENRDPLIDTVRSFVAERLRPLEAKVAEDDAVPDDVVAEMRELGLFGLSIPEEYGGLDLSMEDECLVAVELGRTSPAFRSAFGTNVGIGSQGLVMFGTPSRRPVAARYASGEIITSFALSARACLLGVVAGQLDGAEGLVADPRVFAGEEPGSSWGGGSARPIDGGQSGRSHTLTRTGRRGQRGHPGVSRPGSSAHTSPGTPRRRQSSPRRWPRRS